jgi:hypothetical protein
MTHALRTRAFALALIACALTAMGAVACDSGTEGRAVAFELALESAVSAGATTRGEFDTDTGWHVVLDEARIALGPIYLYGDEGALTLRSLGRALVPVAHAHGGADMYIGRIVRGEYLDAVVFDALAPERLALGTVSGRAGHASALRVDVAGPAADLAGLLRAHSAWVHGVASKDGATVTFEGGLDIPDDGLARHIDGIPMDVAIDDGVTVVVALQLRAWFAAAHFDRLTERGADGTYAIGAATQVRTAWYLGARSLSAFSTSHEPAL